MLLLTKYWNRLQENRITKTVLPFTLVSPERVRNLYRLALQVEKEKIPGDMVECGVCNGGTGAVLARVASHSGMNRLVWLLDSFQGMPEVSVNDADSTDGDKAKDHVGKEVGDVRRVREVLRRVRANMECVRIVPGWFQDTLPSVRAEKIAILNIDADWYESVRLCLETMYDRVAIGGFVSFDDYGHWPGCKKAVDEFFSSCRLPYTLQRVDYTAHWFRKT